MEQMFRYGSDQSLYLDAAPETVDLEALGRIAGVVNLHPAYSSVLVVFDPVRTTHEEVQRAVEQVAAGGVKRVPRRHVIPVDYTGPDLEAVAARHGLTVDRVVELHAGAVYRGAFLGFVPGFADRKSTRLNSSH